MKLIQSMIAWNPAHGEAQRGHEVKVGPWPDRTGWSRSYDNTGGSCYMERHDAELWQQIALMFIDFHTLVVGDNMDPQAVHEAFLAIDEYRERISPDIPGADRD
ncbi:hypothetical protein P7D22_20025 [Lichenihabitans sp. Uapishka_5]|uniref:hypothetical protein n=1 Tax=Lichenihabitans sp. Uapishka_5 TaxID=3037302 RepID=UPI0029E7E54D|nr:hypothetical protein [Lichenihabitans sp. Uapishka_5]MDX7953457.1 hypothetical protein [Lichenihabitans sp. Uapishka_5]